VSWSNDEFGDIIVDVHILLSRPAMLQYLTQGFQGYAVKYSPFFDNRIAVAASANYGLVGNGRLFILELGVQGIKCLRW